MYDCGFEWESCVSHVRMDGMPRILTDAEIAALLAEEQPLPKNYERRLRPVPGTSYRGARAALSIQGVTGNRFTIDVRDNPHILLDFSIILRFMDADGSEYRLLRYNGKHPSEHTNRWENKRGLPNAKFRNAFHIHRATERYQLEGYPIDGYAETTNAYYSRESALRALISDNGFTYESPGLRGQQNLTMPNE